MARPDRCAARRGIAAVLLAVVLALAAGCRDDAPGEGPAGYQLDQPDLADLTAGAVTSGVPVLCYHYFRGNVDPGYLARVTGSLLFGLPALSPKEFWTISAGEFERHLAHFAKTGTRVMTLDEVAGHLQAGLPVPPRAVVLTIDDADRSVYELAFPLLRKYGMRAHVFVPTAEVGRSWSGLDVCSWQELERMQESGLVVLGSHTNRLHFKTKTPRGPEPVYWSPELIPEKVRLGNLREIKEELARGETAAVPASWKGTDLPRFRPVLEDLVASRMQLLRHSGSAARWLAWPYGFGNGDLDSVARSAGFAGTVSLHPRTFDRPGSTWHVGRFTLTAKTTIAQIERLFAQPPAAGPSLAGRSHP